MKKSSLFISGILTTFVLAVLAGSLTLYRMNKKQDLQVSKEQPAPVVVTSPSSLTLEQAAQVAARYLGRTDLYSAEETTLNGMKAILVTFSSGDVVYISTDGQVLAYIPVNVVAYQAPLPSQLQPMGSSVWNEERDGGDDD